MREKFGAAGAAEGDVFRLIQIWGRPHRLQPWNELQKQPEGKLRQGVGDAKALAPARLRAKLLTLGLGI